MKKAQMEIFGLAIIFLLIIVALLLFLRFSTPREEVASDFFFVQLPTKTIQTILHTTTDCQGQDVAVLISDIGSHVTGQLSDPACGDVRNNNQIECNGDHSYDELFNDINGVIPTILDNSLTLSRINYQFTIKMRSGCIIHQTPNGCEGAKKINAQTFTLTSRKGPVEVNLRIC